MRARTSSDDGAGLLSTSVGVLVFLALLLLAVQVVFALYATSTLTAAAWDAARIASGSDAAPSGDESGGTGPQPRVAAERHLRSVLGDYSERVEVTWVDDPDDVVLHVRARHPSFLPSPLRRAMGLDAVERTVRVRREGLR